MGDKKSDKKDEKVTGFQGNGDSDYDPKNQPAPEIKSEISTQPKAKIEYFDAEAGKIDAGETPPVIKPLLSPLEEKLTNGVSENELNAIIVKEGLKSVPGTSGGKNCIYLKDESGKLYIVEKKDSNYKLVVGLGSGKE